MGRARPWAIALCFALAWTSPSAHADSLARWARLCVALIVGQPSSPPAPATPLPPSPIAEVPPSSLDRFAETPLGARVRLHPVGNATGSTPVEGIAVALDFRTLRLAVDGTTREVPWETVTRVEVLEPTLTGDASPTMLVEQERGADRRRRQYLAFQRRSEAHWNRVAETFGTALERFRALDKHARQARLGALADQVDEAFAQLTGNRSYGLHFNSKGAAGFEYVESGGIRATRGDSMLSVTAMSYGIGAFSLASALESKPAPAPNTVFYYRSSLGRYVLAVEPRTATTRSPGHYVMAFDPEAIIASGHGKAYRNASYPAVEFPRLHVDGIGVRYETDFLLPPLLLNTDVPRRVGRVGLAKDEQQLASLLHLLSLFADPDIERFRPSALREPAR
jgi:hypothetical protein